MGSTAARRKKIRRRGRAIAARARAGAPPSRPIPDPFGLIGRQRFEAIAELVPCRYGIAFETAGETFGARARSRTSGSPCPHVRQRMNEPLASIR